METFESIRTRLQKQAAVRFGRTPESLSQETRLFIDWMASELGNLHKDLHCSNDAILNKIRQRLKPDVTTRPKPAHAIAYAQPRQHGYVLRPEEDEFTLPRLSQEPPHQLFYAPLAPIALMKGKVKFLAYDRYLTEIVEHNIHQVRASSTTSNFFHPGVLWIGLLWNDLVSQEQSISFYLDWKIEDSQRKSEFYKALPLVTWLHQGQKIPARTGFYSDSRRNQSYQSKFIDEEFLHLYKIEKDIIDYYSAKYVTIELNNPSISDIPNEVSETFNKEVVQDLSKEPILWLKLIFPDGFTPEVIQKTTIQVNCFPIINRKLDRTRDFTPATGNHQEIISLSNADRGRASLSEMGAHFLGIQHIFTKNKDYRPVVFDQFRQAPAGYYALQRGKVEANDLRDIYARIAELSDILRTHVSTLLLLPQHTVNQAIADIENGAEMLKNATSRIPAKDNDLGYYLHIKADNPQDMVYVRFWLTQGRYADENGGVGEILTSEKSNCFEGDVATFITREI